MELTARQAAERAGCDPRTAQRTALRAIRGGDANPRRIGPVIVADEAWWTQALETSTKRGRKPKTE